METEDIKIVTKKISNKQLRGFLGKPFAEMVKFVIDVEKRIIALGGEMHADAEQVLLENGSQQENLWGGNLYPDAKAKKKIEYTSLINIRPSQNNRTIEIQDKDLQDKIKEIVFKLVEL